ncbi:uncharacterized protein BO97DRAFT_229586 [Aspergillus homomorphus CBS 101889]|uniref:Uncharacterized protein n=1 Tax=Aspergillus homomorphus (strain CBS 101889) TaxID=1450537 RepID=A0A395HJI0_ASPHC|nr:hypothetical protein BO97DRAFT_229586 [Aspergillus homomorphus CBS 101889]RAL07977.1 hypothetical protein BO97DRAFT_229586 [Aspergillus homomorphus CBS 101889]
MIKALSMRCCDFSMTGGWMTRRTKKEKTRHCASGVSGKETGFGYSPGLKKKRGIALSGVSTTSERGRMASSDRQQLLTLQTRQTSKARREGNEKGWRRRGGGGGEERGKSGWTEGIKDGGWGGEEGKARKRSGSRGGRSAIVPNKRRRGGRP